MNIRPARSFDALAIVDIMCARLPDSRYAHVAEIDVQLARRIFAQAAQRHGGTNDGAMFLMVAVDETDAVEAFILGSIGRLYGICKELVASDDLLLGREDCNPRALVPLFRSYIAWAEANPRVIEIGASWSDTIPGNEGITALFERSGFALCGKVYRRDAGASAEDVAA
jgi:hypothetical protein